MKKRILAIVLTVVLVLAAVAGCAGKPQNADGSGSEAASTEDTAGQQEKKEPIELEFWTISLRPSFDDFFNGLIDNYQKEHEEITIKWIDMPYDTIQSKLITATAGGNSPDAVNLDTPMVLSLISKGALADLEKEASEEQRNVYIKTLYDLTKIGGSAYAFPWYGGPTVTLYNKEIFEKSGLTGTPATFDEMLEMAKTVKQKTGAYLYIPEYFYYRLYLDGISILNEEKTSAAFNTPETLKILNEYKSAVDEGYMPKNGWGNWDNMLQQFSTGKLAMMNSGPQSIKRIKDEAPDIYAKLEIAEPMVGKAGISMNPIMNMAVPQASEHHKEAIDFAHYITNDENQLGFSKVVAVFPSTIKAAQDPFFKSDTATAEGRATAVAAEVALTSSELTLGVAKEGDILLAVQKIYEAVMQGGEKPEDALAEAEKKVNELLKQK